MTRPSPPAHLTLAKALAADLDPGYYVRAQDLPAFPESEELAVLDADHDLITEAFDPAHYLEIRNSAVYLTRQTKAMALYDYLESATRAVAREFVCGFVNDELAQRMVPGDEERLPDMPATESPLDRVEVML